MQIHLYLMHCKFRMVRNNAVHLNICINVTKSQLCFKCAVRKTQEHQECQQRTEYITFRPITMIICYAGEKNIVNKDMKTLSDPSTEICLT
jgi:hypothetical protein